jgi:CBS domain-containing protein
MIFIVFSELYYSEFHGINSKIIEDMNLNMPISDIMTKNVLFVHYNNKLDEVEHLMKSKNIRHIPVLKEGKLCGIVSLTDLDRLSFTKGIGEDDDKEFLYNTLSIEDVMMSSPVTIASDGNLKEAAELLVQRDFHALPVVDNDLLVGIVTTTDLMKIILQEESNLA